MHNTVLTAAQEWTEVQMDNKKEELLYLIRIYLENISEEIDRAKRETAQLEGVLKTLNIERSRLESLREIRRGDAR